MTQVHLHPHEHPRGRAELRPRLPLHLLLLLAEAQFIVGMENETPETLEETFRMAMDWKPDMVNWNCYTPWPFSDLFEELGDKVQVHYRRFFLRKTFLEYPFIYKYVTDS